MSGLWLQIGSTRIDFLPALKREAFSSHFRKPVFTQPEHVIESDGERREQLRAEPQGNRTILGRLLVGARCTPGPQDSPAVRPAMLSGPSSGVGAAALRRGVSIEPGGPDGRNALIIEEDRPDSYVEALAALFRSLTEAEVTSGGYRSIIIGESALSDFDVPKKWNDGAT